ncbi:MAG TPA: hypothetical protein VKG44_03430 [Candidatus Baltobacteraceae bacterium]|nr:hypothetical protein [Candidatus Baltobacteraceae bacterium]
MRLLAGLTVLAALTLALPLSAPAATADAISASQNVPTDELLRWVYQGQFPPECGAAQQVAANLRVKPTTDPGTMHKAMMEDIACGNSSFGQLHDGLATRALFGAAAAALLAARGEPMPAAARDAYFARDASRALVDYNRDVIGPADSPSVNRTNAGRLNADAIALLAALRADGAAPASPIPVPTLPH